MTISSVPATSVPDSAFLLDVREDNEWAAGHAPNAVHIPMGDVPTRIAEIDSDKDLYVVCKAGGRSMQVGQYLSQNGYDVTNVDGGMGSWADAGLPLTRDDGGQASIL